MTINRTWGYSPLDVTHKSVNQLIRILAECVSMGGNLLLNVGPKADGTIREQQVTVLKEMGGWLGENGEAVYGTVAGPARIHYGLPSTLSKTVRFYTCMCLISL
jgi:alpha-L-fucosidase